FGGFGAIGMRLGYGVGLSTAMGFGGGFVFAALVYLFTWYLFSQQASSLVEVKDLKGATAEVSVAIPPQGIGQVRCTMGGSVIERDEGSTDGGGRASKAGLKDEAAV